jgi:hypothetical protein
MITIYVVSPLYHLKSDPFFYNVTKFTEEELLRRVEDDDCAVWFVHAHFDSVFRRKFINEHLSEDGYVIEGYYNTFLCGRQVDFRIVEDVNHKINRGEKLV